MKKHLASLSLVALTGAFLVAQATASYHAAPANTAYGTSYTQDTIPRDTSYKKHKKHMKKKGMDTTGRRDTTAMREYKK